MLLNQRTVYCEDAIHWLKIRGVQDNSSFVASLPDVSEFPKLSITEWQNWFKETAKLILLCCPPEGATIFYQSDIKVEGVWIDKGYLCQRAAEEVGHSLLWHKVVCRTSPGQRSFGRPGYSHLLCFSQKLRLLDTSKSSPDVIPDLGEKTWERGMGLSAALLIAQFVLEQTSTSTIVNPFCGEGAVLAAANALGLNAVGVERSHKRVEKARHLEVSGDRSSWVEKSL